VPRDGESANSWMDYRPSVFEDERFYWKEAIESPSFELNKILTICGGPLREHKKRRTDALACLATPLSHVIDLYLV